VKVVYASDCDPITDRDVAVIEAAEENGWQLQIVFPRDLDKPLFSLEERIDLVRTVCAMYGADVGLADYTGIHPADLADWAGADALLCVADSQEELDRQMKGVNALFNPRMRQMGLVIDPALEMATSRGVLDLVGPFNWESATARALPMPVWLPFHSRCSSGLANWFLWAWGRFALNGSTAGLVYSSIVQEYLDVDRTYHDFSHLLIGVLAIDEMVKSDRNLRLDLDWETVCLAWFIHDLVVRPGAEDNELKSAIAGSSIYRAAGLSDAGIVAVSGCVLGTRHLAEEAPTSLEEAVVRDADLSSLAAAWSCFDMDGRRLDREFGRPEEEGRAARRSFYESMLARPRIFHTAYGHRCWEEKARANMRRALSELT
jgi:predicted metal-dependent HD superfamily phosphohydrolase/phosphopantetheine adenylyltransferase